MHRNLLGNLEDEFTPPLLEDEDWWSLAELDEADEYEEDDEFWLLDGEYDDGYASFLS